MHPCRPELFSSGSDHNVLVWDMGRHPWKEEEEEKAERARKLKPVPFFAQSAGADAWSSEEEEEGQ